MGSAKMKRGMGIGWIVGVTAGAASGGEPLMGIRDVEPTNNTQAGATSIGTGGRLITRGVLNLSPGDNDWFSLSGGFLTADDSYVIVITPLGALPGSFATPDTIVEVRSPANVLIASDDDAGSDLPAASARGSVVRFDASLVGDYHIRVTGFDGNTSGAYMMTLVQANLVGADTFPDWVSDLEVVPPGSHELDVTTFPTTYGFGASSGINDSDFMAVVLAAGDLLTVSAVGVDGLDANWSDPNIDLAILDVNGVSVLVSNGADAAGQSPGGANSGVGGTIRFRAPADGKYFIRFNTSAGGGFYGVAMSYVPATGCDGDADGNGVVNFADITSVLANFNLACP